MINTSAVTEPINIQWRQRKLTYVRRLNVRARSSVSTLLGILSPTFINLGPLFGGANTSRALGRYLAIALKTGPARGRSLPSRLPMSGRNAAQRQRTEWYGANAVSCQTGSKERHELRRKQCGPDFRHVTTPRVNRCFTRHARRFGIWPYDEGFFDHPDPVLKFREQVIAEQPKSRYTKRQGKKRCFAIT
jgi:hypothetical protein